MAFHYNVAPRYTPGSPAQVPEAIARRVAVEERTGYERALTGVYGVEQRMRAEQRGLRGIAEERVERAGAWDVTDLITGERFVRPFVPMTNETAEQRDRRFWKLRAKFRLPLERELPPASAAHVVIDGASER